MSLHEPLSGGINNDEPHSQAHAQPTDGEHLQFARPTPGDTPSAALCPWCPCGHVERQLGLQAADQTDSLRVWLRFGSIALMVSAELGCDWLGDSPPVRGQLHSHPSAASAHFLFFVCLLPLVLLPPYCC